MTTRILMPQIGESVTEGTILRWLKQPGEPIARDEPLVEVMTDKVNVEIPCTVAGTVAALLAAEGDTIPVGAPMAEISSTASAMPPTAVAASEFAGAESRISPVVRKLAQEHGIDLNAITGSGTGGRITKQDILTSIERKSAPTTGQPPGQPMPPAAAAMRRAIAEHLGRAYREVPTAWTMQEVDMTGVVRWRAARRDEFRANAGVDLTYLPFVLQAAALALREVPALNSRWDDGRVVPQSSINLSIAVALDDGLVVPVIRNADQLDLAGLARTAGDLANRARAGALSPADMQGGTFTVNNTGAFGSIVSVPIINAPQAGILTMEAIVKRPVVLAGDTIAVRSMMNICLTFDHRVVDGAMAGRFLQAVRRALERFGGERAENAPDPVR